MNSEQALKLIRRAARHAGTDPREIKKALGEAGAGQKDRTEWRDRRRDKALEKVVRALVLANGYLQDGYITERIRELSVRLGWHQALLNLRFKNWAPAAIVFLHDEGGLSYPEIGQLLWEMELAQDVSMDLGKWAKSTAGRWDGVPFPVRYRSPFSRRGHRRRGRTS